MKNKYATCEWFLPVPGPAAIKMAGKLGYDGIQLYDLGGSGQNFPLNDPRTQALYKEAMDEAGIVIQAFNPATSVMDHGGVCQPISSSKGQELIHNFKKSLEVCTALDCKTIMIPGLYGSKVENEEHYKNTCEMLKLLSSISADSGVVLAYESFLPTYQLVELLDYAGKNLKLTYDNLNPLRDGFATPWEEIKTIGADPIDHVHLKDCYSDMVGSCPLGCGATQLDKSLAALKEVGYSGWYVCENYYYRPPHMNLGSGWELAAADLEYMHRMCE